MSLTKQAFNYLTELEDFRAEVYTDSGGVMTIGYGHTRSAIMPSKVSLDEAEELLQQDLEYFIDKVNELVKVPLNENQYSALVLFMFNVGEGAFKRSTMLKLINKHEFSAAGKEFHKWDKATIKGLKKRLAGLTKRRAMERVLWDTPPMQDTYTLALPAGLFSHMFTTALQMANDEDPEKRDRGAAAFALVSGVGEIELKAHVPTFIWKDAMSFVSIVEQQIIAEQELTNDGNGDEDTNEDGGPSVEEAPEHSGAGLADVPQ
jgi:lysozyme